MQDGGSYRRWIAVVLACVAPVAAEPRVCINEFMASNSTCLADSKGQYEDWIELHNPGSSLINVGGMYLTDDIDDPTRWRIPDQTTIPAGGFLLIWADGSVNDAGFHAGFKLSSSGEEIGLFDGDGAALVDDIAFGRQTSDVSFGRYPDAGADWAFMVAPTPGATNMQVFAGVVAEVTFSVEHGSRTARRLVEPAVRRRLRRRAGRREPSHLGGHVPPARAQRRVYRTGQRRRGRHRSVHGQIRQGDRLRLSEPATGPRRTHAGCARSTSLYGSGWTVAGQYQGALANDGESIALTDAIGRTILDFAYDDAWYDSTDGDGHSLECWDPRGLDPNALSWKDSWRPSGHLGGSPGRD